MWITWISSWPLPVKKVITSLIKTTESKFYKHELEVNKYNNK